MKKLTKNNRKLLAIIILLVLLGIAIGYAALSQTLTIEGTANISSEWNVQFTSITLSDSSGATDAEGSPSLSGTTKAIFNVTLDKPGSYAEYKVVVENKGSINAKLESITDLTAINNTEPTDIKFTITGPAADSALNSKATAEYTVRVEWLSTSTEIPETKTKTAEIELNYVQAD